MAWCNSLTARCAAAAAAAALLLPAPPARAAFKYLKTGMEAADFELRTLDEGEITLASLKQGPGSLLVFWATWSPKSEPALREAQRLHERFAASGLRVVAVNVNRPELGLLEREEVRKAAADLGLTLPVALDPGLATCATVGIVANPSLALLDGRGVLVWDAAGWSRAVEEGLRAQVETLLGLRQKAVEPTARQHSPERKALLNYNLGRSFLRQGNRAKARTQFEAAAESDAAWAAPRSLLGHLLLQQGGARDLAEAEGHFRAAVAIDGGDVSALTGLGEVLIRSGNAEEAAATLEKAHALDPAFTPAVAGRALALARLGQQGEALALFELALELNPRDAAIFAGRAECRELAGNAAEAAADYRRAVEILLAQ